MESLIDDIFNCIAATTKKRSAWMVIVHGTGKDKKYLVGKRAKTARNSKQWGFFGGQTDLGETPKQGAIRETNEETGYHPEKVTKLGSHKLPTKTMHYYFHRSEYQFTPKLDPKETEKHAWVSRKQLNKLNLHHSAELYFKHVKPALLLRKSLKK